MPPPLKKRDHIQKQAPRRLAAQPDGLFDGGPTTHQHCPLILAKFIEGYSGVSPGGHENGHTEYDLTELQSKC